MCASCIDIQFLFFRFAALPSVRTHDSLRRSCNVAFYERERGVFYVQGSYPLNERAHCAEDETAQCLFAINVTTGTMLHSRVLAPKGVSIYHYQDYTRAAASDGTVLAWVFHPKCGGGGPASLDRVGFALIHMETGEARALVSKTP